MRRILWIAMAIGLAAGTAAPAGAVGFDNVSLPNADVAPGAWVLVQEIDADAAATVTKVKVFNMAPPPRVQGADVEEIQVRRADNGKVMRSLTTLANLATGTGVEVTTSQNNVFTGAFRIEVWAKLKAAAPLGSKLALGGTVVTHNPDVPVDYAANAAATFTVGPPPAIAFDGSVGDAEVYRGQKFLAGRIELDSSDVPFEVTIAQLVLENGSGGTKLTGAYVERIEVRRASDDALLGQQAAALELAKLTTTGAPVVTGSNNKIPAFGVVHLEIWITMKGDAPTAHRLKLAAIVRCGGTDFAVGGAAPEFTVGQPGGFETLGNEALTGGQVFSGQRFLAQRIVCTDDDIDPYDVTLNSLVIENVGDAATRLAESQIASIEVVRARDGMPMGQVADASGMNAGGVRITTAANNEVADDTAIVLEIWLTLAASVPHGRAIKLRTVVWHTEDSTIFGKPHGGPESAAFVTGPDVGQGFERATATTLADRVVFQGVRFLAQRLRLRDDDLDPYDIAITSLMIRNAAADSPLSDQYVARVEVRRRSDGALLGRVTDPVGLSLSGVRVPTAANNLAQDDGTLELEIWVTLKGTIPTGRKLRLESIVWHREGTATHQTVALLGPGTATTDIGTPPKDVNFSFTPAAPKFDNEISFVPAEGITDPEGDITKARFRWDFGDGKAKETTGSATVKHTYGSGGDFSVSLTVTGEDGLSTTRTKKVTVEGPPNEPPVVTDLTVTPQNPAVDEDVTFAVTVTDEDHPEGPFTYAWDFGDETTSAESSPTHRFAQPGKYTVGVTVTDPRGATATQTTEIIVGNKPPTLTGVTATPTAAATGDAVEFRAAGYADEDGDALARYEWDFKDGTKLAAGRQVETHVYAAPGTYAVSVVAVDERGGKSAPKTVRVTISGPARAVVYAFPNPAKTGATIAYLLPAEATDPILRIYALDGELVFERELPAAGARFEWDLRGLGGDPVPSGLYFCVVTVAGGNPSDVFRLLVAR